jgi:hypothetical protein
MCSDFSFHHCLYENRESFGTLSTLNWDSNNFGVAPVPVQLEMEKAFSQ